MKCSICRKEIKETFLDKIKGTYFKIGGELKPVCSNCQKKLSKSEIKKKLKE